MPAAILPPAIAIPTVIVPLTVPTSSIPVVAAIDDADIVAVFAVTDTTFCPLNPPPPITCPAAIVPTT